ncbi:MAG: hypothetical protein KDJ77_19070 [Rhodobiaceae bacterium]|nr:hypothetical protein [Rhodobiaceae bacterium]
MFGTAIRLMALALLAYYFGGPAFDGQRPAAIDKTLVQIHRGIDQDLRSGSVLAVKADGVRQSAKANFATMKIDVFGKAIDALR